MSTDEIQQLAGEKWQAFYRASSAAGIWLIAFMAALALAIVGKEVGLFVGLLLSITFGMSATLSLLTIGALIEAQSANRKVTALRNTHPCQDS